MYYTNTLDYSFLQHSINYEGQFGEDYMTLPAVPIPYDKTLEYY